LHVVAFPEPSAARKVFVVVPRGNVAPLGSPRTCVVVLAPQRSTPAGVAYETAAPHVPGSVLTLTSEGHPSEGASASATVTWKLQVAKFPAPSTTRKVFVVRPSGKTAPLANPPVCD